MLTSSTKCAPDGLDLLQQISADDLRTQTREEAELDGVDIITFAEKWLGVSFEERPAARVVLKAIYGLELDPQELEIYQELTGNSRGQQHGLDTPSTETVLVLGARSGKSFLTSIMAIYEAVARGHIWRRYLSPGETGYAIVIATSKEQAINIIQANAARLLQNSPKLQGWLVGEPLKAELTLKNGLKIKSLPCNTKAGLGIPIFFLALDEVGHFFIEGVKADSDIYNSISPRLAQFHEAKKCLISTPAGKQGLLWKWFEEGFAVPGRTTFHATTEFMNPMVDRKFLAHEKKRDIDNYNREFMAQFAEKMAAFFSSDSLDAAFTLDGDLLPQPGVWYFCGIDQSGISGRDRFALSISHRDNEGRVIIDACRSWDAQGANELLDEITALRDAYGLRGATIDRYAKGWVQQALEGIGLEVSVRAGLPEVYQNAKSLLLAGLLALPNNAELRAGLVNTAAYYGRNNALSIQHDRGSSGHADLADAVCTAAWCASQAVEYAVVERFNAVQAFGGIESWEQ